MPFLFSFILVIQLQLDFLPFSCRYLEKLKVLDLYGNPMKTFPAFLKRHPILKVEDLGIDVSIIQWDDDDGDGKADTAEGRN